MVWLESLKCILKCWSLWAAVTDERTLDVLNKRVSTLFLYRFSFENIKRVIYWRSAAFNQMINSRIRSFSLRGCSSLQRTNGLICWCYQRKQNGEHEASPEVGLTVALCQDVRRQNNKWFVWAAGKMRWGSARNQCSPRWKQTVC